MSLHGRRRSRYYKRFVEDSVHCLLIERLPTSTVKEQMFLLTKLKTRRQCTCTFYIFQSDPRVVFSVADVLACLPLGDSMVQYSDNADVVFSVADVSLSSADSRSTVLS